MTGSAHYAIELPVLGLATRFETNDAEVARCVEEAFGMWRALAASAVVGATRASPLLVCVEVVDGDEGPLPAGRTRARALHLS